VIVLGAALVAISIGVVTVFVPSGWVFPVAVLAGALGMTLVLLHQWRRGPLHGRLRPDAQRRTLAETVFSFACALLVATGLVTLVVYTGATTPPFCVCATRRDALTWSLLVLGGAAEAIVLTLTLIALFASFRLLTRRESA
jgi:hypothetical protein